MPKNETQVERADVNQLPLQKYKFRDLADRARHMASGFVAVRE